MLGKVLALELKGGANRAGRLADPSRLPLGSSPTSTDDRLNSIRSLRCACTFSFFHRAISRWPQAALAIGQQRGDQV